MAEQTKERPTPGIMARLLRSIADETPAYRREWADPSGSLWRRFLISLGDLSPAYGRSAPEPTGVVPPDMVFPDSVRTLVEGLTDEQIRVAVEALAETSQEALAALGEIMQSLRHEVQQATVERLPDPRLPTESAEAVEYWTNEVARKIVEAHRLLGRAGLQLEIHLDYANLEDVDLSGLDLSQAHVYRVIWSGTTVWPSGTVARVVRTRSVPASHGRWMITEPSLPEFREDSTR